ncbi:MAG: sugar phosphate nucleotidyltransferase [Bacilli bacterium]
MTLVIMAAGMGSRFGGLKQVEPIGPNGEFIIDYSIYDAIKVGIDKVVFIIKEENYDLFRETIGKRIESKVKVEYVFQKIGNIPSGIQIPKERVKPWGTSHAILSCKDAVKDNFIVINADDFYGYDSFKLIFDYMNDISPDSYHFSMAGYMAKNTLTVNGKVKRGVCLTNENNYLRIITESSIGYEGANLIAERLDNGDKVSVTEEQLVSMNFFGFTPKIFNYLEDNFQAFFEKNKNNLEKCEYLIPDSIQEMINNGICDVKVLKTPAIWHGVTYKEDKDELVSAINDLISEGKYPDNLWK